MLQIFQKAVTSHNNRWLATFQASRFFQSLPDHIFVYGEQYVSNIAFSWRFLSHISSYEQRQ